MDEIAAKGLCGMIRTIPKSLGAGSDVAIMSILGYDPRKFYTGRGPLEAASIGVDLNDDDVAIRCNLATEKDGILIDYSAGHIETGEAEALIAELKNKLEKPNEISFYTGISYRHLIVLKGKKYSEKIRCTPPHDAIGRRISEILIEPLNGKGEETAKTLNRMIIDSKKILSKHPVNLRRVAEKKNPGNIIWPWSPGKRLKIQTFKEKYGIKAAVISAVDLVRGLGYYAGMDVIEVPGATGYYDTNYEGKAECALKSLEDHDFAVVHVEAPDEAAHIGDFNLKIKTIEDLDRRLIGKIFDALKGQYAIAILSDHATPIKVKTHTHDPVPFAIYSTVHKYSKKVGAVKRFDESSAKKGSVKIEKGYEFMPLFLKGKQL
jgi:2,3-bisphosphoglycerate-independent phosphoglycerate mutase